jgi:capsular polysaccharide biosynthesis protein
MELKDYFKILKRYVAFLIIFPLAVGLAAFLFSYYTPITYDTSISFAINRINKEKTSDYQYDGYYAIQASDLFSQTVVSWLSTPSVLLEIYDNAKIDPQISSIDKFSSRFKTKKYSPQNIVVRFNERDRVTSEKIAKSIQDVLSDKVSKLNQNPENKALFELASSSPVIVEKKPEIILLTIIGLISGFIFALLLTYIINYFKKEEPV